MVEGPYEVHDYTVSESTTIEQFTLCKLADARLAAASDGSDPFAGITMTEHVGSKGKTEVGLTNTGIWDLRITPGAAITAGALVKLSGANLITGGVVEADVVAGKVVGKILEDTGAGVAETVEVDIGVRG